MALKFMYAGFDETDAQRGGVFHCNTRKISKAKLHIEKELNTDFGLWKAIKVVHHSDKASSAQAKFAANKLGITAAIKASRH